MIGCMLLWRSTASDMPLFDYVKMPDDTYKYEPLDAACNYQGLGWKSYAFNMTSQKWLDEKTVSRSIWWHYFIIMVPDIINPATADKASIYVTGGRNDQGCPKEFSEDIILGGLLATTTQSVVAVLYQIPNQPMIYYEEQPPKKRDEDANIAWTWKHFLEDQSNPYWLLRMPMVKAVVRAMDTVTHFSNNQIQQFMIAGASKRGWTTWLVGVVDSRVIGMIPMVLDELNFVKNMKHHWQAYGGWSWVLKDYYRLNITKQLDTPQMAAMMKIIDPISYADIMTLPKLILSSAGDEFLVTDNVNYFWNQLQGESHFHTMPNCEHTLAENLPGVLETISGFMISVMHNIPRPSYKWSFNPDGTIVFESSNLNPPSKVLLWKAYTIDGNLRRDFRLVKCKGNCTNPSGGELHPVFWSSSPLSPIEGTQTYMARVDPPASGWVGFIIEAYFPVGVLNATFSISSGPSILPKAFPYPECYGEDCYGSLL